jgi:hypothetical protein
MAAYGYGNEQNAELNTKSSTTSHAKLENGDALHPPDTTRPMW